MKLGLIFRFDIETDRILVAGFLIPLELDFLHTKFNTKIEM